MVVVGGGRCLQPSVSSWLDVVAVDACGVQQVLSPFSRRGHGILCWRSSNTIFKMITRSVFKCFRNIIENCCIDRNFVRYIYDIDIEYFPSASYRTSIFFFSVLILVVILLLSSVGTLSSRLLTATTKTPGRY